MDCPPICPRCQGKLEFSHAARSNQEMFKCPECFRWWRHMWGEGGCGLYGTIKNIGKETLTLCSKETK